MVSRLGKKSKATNFIAAAVQASLRPRAPRLPSGNAVPESAPLSALATSPGRTQWAGEGKDKLCLMLRATSWSVGQAGEMGLAPQEGQSAGPPSERPRSALCRLEEEPLLGRVTEVSAPSQMQGLCRGSSPLLTRNFGLCTLELVEFLEKPARLEHRSLNRQIPVLRHRGTRWDNCKCPDSDLHRLNTQGRRGSVVRAARGRGGCRAGRLPRDSCGPGDGALCPDHSRGPERHDGPRAGGNAHPLPQELSTDVCRCASPDLAEFCKAKQR